VVYNSGITGATCARAHLARRISMSNEGNELEKTAKRVSEIVEQATKHTAGKVAAELNTDLKTLVDLWEKKLRDFGLLPKKK
jgi:hypothetical protein